MNVGGFWVRFIHKGSCEGIGIDVSGYTEDDNDSFTFQRLQELQTLSLKFISGWWIILDLVDEWQFVHKIGVIIKFIYYW